MEWKTWLMILGIGGGCLISALYWFQHRLMFFPDVPMGHRRTMLKASDFGMPEPEETMIPTGTPGVRVQVWMFKHPDGHNRHTVVFFHGNAGNLSFRMENYKGLYNSGFNVLAVEYRGFGLSDGTPSETAIRADTLVVMQWLMSRDDIDTDKIVLFGRSIGGAVALHTAVRLQDKLAGVIVENTFTCIGDLIDVLLPKLSLFKILNSNPWHNAKCVDQLTKVPLMFISSGKDELIPPSHMKSLHDLAHRAPSRVWQTFPHAGHMNAHTSHGYNKRISDFISKL